MIVSVNSYNLCVASQFSASAHFTAITESHWYLLLLIIIIVIEFPSCFLK